MSGLVRKVRRQADRLKPLAERTPKNTLGQFLASLRQSLPGCRVHNEGYRGGARMLYEVATFGDAKKGGRMVASFRHPTKRATPGRMNFVTVTT